MQNQTAISLFSCGGIGDLALRAAGYEILLSNELDRDRHAVFESNFPNVTSITGDVWELADQITETALKLLDGRPLDLLFATPPCQGMSKNGRGKLLSAIRVGDKPPLDLRNRLIIPTIEVAVRLQPRMILLENVPEMENTIVLDRQGEAVSILGYIQRELGAEYCGGAEVVEFADYGVPQCRQRLISVFSRSDRLRSWYADYRTFMPPRTHSSTGAGGTSKWVTLRDVIADLPPLDARSKATAKSTTLFHRVPLLDELKYWWVSSTPTERSAFDNQCVQCGYDDNPIHSARRDDEGVNRASRTTPIHCLKCGALLPRPTVDRNGQPRLMKGYTSAYKRMSYDKPASALTRNLSYACSDNKLHPEQNRVLSLLEAFRVHTLDRFEYQWTRSDGGKVSDKMVREMIGESIPPWGLQQIVEHLTRIYLGRATAEDETQLGGLFALTRSA